MIAQKLVSATVVLCSLHLGSAQGKCCDTAPEVVQSLLLQWSKHQLNNVSIV